MRCRQRPPQPVRSTRKGASGTHEHPYSPWQRGTNENTNGLLRQYSPTGTDLSFYGPGLLDQVTAELNARPRKRLDFETPAEALHRLLSDPTESVASTA